MTANGLRFRAWDKEQSLMLHVDTISFPQGGIHFHDGSMTMGWVEVNKDVNPHSVTIDLMQSTGLTDKNGVEIFDRDWIKNEMGRICEVVWCKSLAAWDERFEADTNYVDGVDMANGFEPRLWEHCVEVIGNYHENPWPLEITYE